MQPACASRPTRSRCPCGVADDEKAKQKKKKLQKSFKSKVRFHRMDQQTKNKAEAWKNFVSGKGGCALQRRLRGAAPAAE